MFPSQRFHRYPPQIWTKIYKKKVLFQTFPSIPSMSRLIHLLENLYYIIQGVCQIMEKSGNLK